jgi:protein-disulfide isomerase
MMTKTLPLLALAATFAVGGAWMLTGTDQPGQTPLTALPGAAIAQEATTEQAATDPAAISIPEMAIGAEDAPVTLIEYASFTCPHCAAFHANQYQQLKPYIDDGRVRFVFREIYFDRYGLWASMTARCAGDPMRFFALTDVLYTTQREWIGEGEPAAIADNLRTLALTAGLTPEQVDACMADQAKAEALVAWFETNATADGVEGTPTLMINGTKYSNMPWEELAAIIDPIVADSGWTAPAE